ncbi:MAG: type II toxin-antitoxin system Phd/YefM family antitoxin [Lachnospiraceae bacterium]|nr:type II toxin-antitoxin system Phd/YefM family antitoxin [Lachnospiraceae bacterium]
MTAINATTARKNLYQLIAEVNTNSTQVTITNNRGKNAVLISEDDWNAIQETLYLNSIPGMAESIIEAKNEPIETETIYEEGEEW